MTSAETAAELDFDEWLTTGRDAGWVGPAVCVFHDSVPATEEEDELLWDGEDARIHILRLYPDRATKDGAETLQTTYAEEYKAEPFQFPAGCSEWVDAGYAAGWISQPSDYIHDGTPLSGTELDELDEGEICAHILRLYPNADVKAGVEANHTPTNWR